MSWSFSALKRQYGEERALEMLQNQRGFGEYAPVTNRPTQLKPRDTETAMANVKVDIVGPSDLDLDHLELVGGSLSRRLHYNPVDVGCRLGTPWRPGEGGPFNGGHRRS